MHIEGKDYEIPEANSRPVVTGIGVRGRETEITIEYKPKTKKLYLVFNNHTIYSAKKMVELDAGVINSFVDILVAARSYLEGKAPIQSVMPHAGKTVDQLVFETTGAIAVEKKVEYKDFYGREKSFMSKSYEIPKPKAD